MPHSRPSSPRPKPNPTSDSSPEASFRFQAIGTDWIIEIFSIVSPETAKRLNQLVMARIDDFDRGYSRFRTDSLVTAMSQKAGDYRLPDDAQPLLDIYWQLYGLSNGQVTPLIGQTLASAGYDADYSLVPGNVQAAPGWDEVMKYDYPSLRIKQPALLDFGAAGKGYLVDIISALLCDNGVSDYCINAGGDISYRTVSDNPLAVGLEHPLDPDQAIGIAHIRNQSLCGSAGNRRAWAGYHHIIHPTLLSSPRHIESLWVVADDTLTADALSTALFFVAPAILLSNFTFEYAIIQADYSLEKSAGFPAEFFTQQEQPHDA